MTAKLCHRKITVTCRGSCWVTNHLSVLSLAYQPPAPIRLGPLIKQLLDTHYSSISIRIELEEWLTLFSNIHQRTLHSITLLRKSPWFTRKMLSNNNLHRACCSVLYLRTDVASHLASRTINECREFIL